MCKIFWFNTEEQINRNKLIQEDLFERILTDETSKILRNYRSKNICAIILLQMILMFFIKKTTWHCFWEGRPRNILTQTKGGTSYRMVLEKGPMEKDTTHCCGMVRRGSLFCIQPNW